MTTTTMAPAESEILAVLTQYSAAHADRDVRALLGLHIDDPVLYTLAPPLQQGQHTDYGSADGLRAWFATFDGPVQLRYRDPVVTACGDVAFVHALTNMTATRPGRPSRSLSGSV